VGKSFEFLVLSFEFKLGKIGKLGKLCKGERGGAPIVKWLEMGQRHGFMSI
jgi:hypothetical protein